MPTINNFVSTNPKITKPRSIFDLSHLKSMDFSAGHLIPISVVPVLPGDTMKCDVASLVRMLTPQKPFMDNVFCDIFAFYVPDRIVWKHAKSFYSGGTDFDQNEGSGDYTEPHIYTRPQSYIRGDYTVRPCTTLDYLGVVRDSTGSASNGVYIDALPLRGLAMIWNRFFRDENLQQSVLIDTGDTGVAYTDAGASTLPEVTSFSTFQANAMKGFYLFPVNRKQDYFSTALPAPLKGGDVLMDLSIPADYDLDSVGTASVWNEAGTQASVDAVNITSTAPGFSNAELWIGGDGPIKGFSHLYGGTINNLIQAFALNDLMTRDARFGSRYVETLHGQFGELVSSDLVDDPVYLGGKRFNINVAQVLQTSNGTSATDSTGALGANSVTHDNSYLFTSSFKEHGYLFLLAAVRFEHKYSGGANDFWFKKDRLDYMWPALANIPDQPIYTRELYNTVSNQNTIFGYKEAWSEYRYQPSRVSGHFRPGVASALTPWTLADAYNTAPILSADWIMEPWQILDRVSYAATSATVKQFYADFYVQLKATRTMPTYSIPGGLTGRF